MMKRRKQTRITELESQLACSVFSLPWRFIGHLDFVSIDSLVSVDELPRLDLNQDKENQNLLCYRYTTG